jgi:hypothetical protein
VADGQVARFPCNVTLTLYPSQTVRLTTTELQTLRREDLVTIWRVRGLLCHVGLRVAVVFNI